MYSSSPSPPPPNPPPDLRYRDNIDFRVALHQGLLFTLEGPWYGLYDHILNAVIFSDIGDKVRVTTRTYPQYPLTLDTDSGHHDFDAGAQDLGKSTPPRSSTLQDDWSSPGVIVSYSPVEIRVFGLDVDDPRSPLVEMNIVGSDDNPGEVVFAGSGDDPQTSPSVDMSSVDSDDETPSVEMSFADSDSDSQTPSVEMNSVGSDDDSGEISFIGSDDSQTLPQNLPRTPSIQMSFVSSDDDPRTPPPARKLKSTRIPDFTQIQYRIRRDGSIEARFLMLTENKKEPPAERIAGNPAYLEYLFIQATGQATEQIYHTFNYSPAGARFKKAAIIGVIIGLGKYWKYVEFRRDEMDMTLNDTPHSQRSYIPSDSESSTSPSANSQLKTQYHTEYGPLSAYYVPGETYTIHDTENSDKALFLVRQRMIELANAPWQ